MCHYASGPFIMKVARQRDDVERTVSQLGRIRLIHKDFTFASVHLLFWSKDAQRSHVFSTHQSQFVCAEHMENAEICVLPAGSGSGSS